MKHAFLLALALLPIPAAHAQNANSYVVTDLSAGNGASIINVTGINNKGQVVGRLDGTYDTFVWTPTTSNATTGTLQGIGIDSGYYPKMNDKGQVIGAQFDTATGGNYHAYIWTKDGGVQYITGGGRYMEVATNINNAGQITGARNYVQGDPPGLSTGWLWQSGTFTNIAKINDPNGPNDLPNVNTVGLNNKGEVVGATLVYNSATDRYFEHAFLWQNGVTQDLGVPTGYGSSSATDINDNGQVIGSLRYPEQGYYSSYFLWQNGIFTNIGGNTADDINNKGDIVGHYYDNQSGSHALIWHKGQWYRLDGGASAPYYDPFSGGFGIAINDVGQIAVSGRNSNGFLLTPNIVLGGVSVSPNPVAAGSTATGKVTLKYPVFVDTVVTLTNSNPNASVPASVTVPSLKTSVTFPITTTTGTATGTVTANTNGPSGTMTKTATLTVNSVSVTALAFSPATVTGGAQNATGTVTLSAPAPSGGAVVSLASNNGAVTFAAPTVTVPAGAASVTFRAYSHKVTAAKTVTVTATYNGTSKTATVTVTPPTLAVTLSALSFNPLTVKGGSANTTGTVTLSAPAPSGGAVVTLASNSSALSFAASTVTVAAGASSATFRAYSHKVTSTKTVTVTATYAGVSKTATVTVTP